MKLLIIIVLVVIYGYSVFSAGREQGRREVAEMCLKELDELRNRLIEDMCDREKRNEPQTVEEEL